MIAALRRTHRIAAAALAVLVPAIIAAALVSRPDVHRAARLPDAILDESVHATRLIADLGRVEGDLPVTARVLGDERGRAVVELTIAKAAEHPDILAYWSTSHDRRGLESSVLLGPVRDDAPSLFALPDDASYADGKLVLYSLAHRDEIAELSIPAIEDLAR